MSETAAVFVCHSSLDAQLASDVAGAIEDVGTKVWIAPRDVHSGESYPTQLMRAIRSCEVFVVLVTAASAASDHVIREIEQAAKQRRRILPVILDDAMSDEIDYYLGSVHRLLGSRDTIVRATAAYFAGGDGQPSETGVSAVRAKGTPSESRALRVGVIPFPPFSAHATDTSPAAGIYIELLRALGAREGFDLACRDITNEDTAPLIGAGEIDVVAALYRTPRRMAQFNFAACFYASTVGAIVREDDDRITTQGDLMRDEVRIAVCRGEIGAELAIDQFGARRGSRRLIEVDTVEVANIAGLVAAGVADVAITDNITCRLLMASAPGRLRHIFADFPLFVGHIGLLLGRDRESLRDRLTSQLTELRQDQSVREREGEIVRGFPGVLQPL